MQLGSKGHINISGSEESANLENAIRKLHWLFKYLNLTQVIREKQESTPWSWYGSMFYAGQLYTTIGLCALHSRHVLTHLLQY